jgi:hypothetical protein
MTIGIYSGKALRPQLKKRILRTIIELTNFPFFQNSYPTYKNEFLELWVSQSFDLRNTDTAVLSSDIVLQMQKPDREETA